METKLIITQDVKEYVREKVKRYYPEITDSEFNRLFERYINLKDFKINENWFDKEVISYDDKDAEIIHKILRFVAEYYMRQVFHALKIDMNDPNVSDDRGGTPYRIIKMLTGDNLEDNTEYMSGRFMRKPRLATFPNELKNGNIITKKLSLTGVCSHHFAPFSTDFDKNSFVLISYIPDKYVIGLSKLTRFIRDYVGRRGWLQEDLTKAIYCEMKEVLQTDDIYVGIFNVKHTCEWLRGAQDKDSSFTTEFYGGKFNNPELRQYVINSIK
jgi:GTP cyclohydrolase I